VRVQITPPCSQPPRGCLCLSFSSKVPPIPALTSLSFWILDPYPSPPPPPPPPYTQRCIPLNAASNRALISLLYMAAGFPTPSLNTQAEGCGVLKEKEERGKGGEGSKEETVEGRGGGVLREAAAIDAHRRGLDQCHQVPAQAAASCAMPHEVAVFKSSPLPARCQRSWHWPPRPHLRTCEHLQAYEECSV
jgi:hypothetical protein